MSETRVPRPKGTYEKLIEKLGANGVKHSPYEKDFDLSLQTERARFVEFLKEERAKESAPDGTSLMFFTRIEEDFANKNDSTKSIAQTHKICDESGLKKYITEVQSNPNCSYKSMYDDIIKSGYIPKYFSVLIKDCHNDPDKIKAELFGSEVANLLGVPTAYNFGIKDGGEKPQKWTGEIIGDYFALGSLDFVPFGYKVESFKDLSVTNYRRVYPSLLMWDDFLETTLMDRFGGSVDEECKKKTHEDFILTYLFRNTLFKDSDFAVYNSGIMVSDDNKKFTLMPNFDMEGLLYDYIYNPYVPTIFGNRSTKHDLSYAQNKYPQLTQKFMTGLEDIYKNGKLKEVLDKTLGTIESPYVYKNVDRLVLGTLGIYSKLKTETKDLSIEK